MTAAAAAVKALNGDVAVETINERIDAGNVDRLLAGATHLLSSVPPDETGDPVLDVHGAAIARAMLERGHHVVSLALETPNWSHPNLEGRAVDLLNAAATAAVAAEVVRAHRDQLFQPLARLFGRAVDA